MKTMTATTKTKPVRIPLFECQECKRPFYSVKSAERASYSDAGCPGCGGSDIDLYVPATATV